MSLSRRTDRETSRTENPGAVSMRAGRESQEIKPDAWVGRGRWDISQGIRFRELSNRRSNIHVGQLREVKTATTAPKSIHRAPEQTLEI